MMDRYPFNCYQANINVLKLIYVYEVSAFQHYTWNTWVQCGLITRDQRQEKPKFVQQGRCLHPITLKDPETRP